MCFCNEAHVVCSCLACWVCTAFFVSVLKEAFQLIPATDPMLCYGFSMVTHLFQPSHHLFGVIMYPHLISSLSSSRWRLLIWIIIFLNHYHRGCIVHLSQQLYPSCTFWVFHVNLTMWWKTLCLVATRSVMRLTSEIFNENATVHQMFTSNMQTRNFHVVSVKSVQSTNVQTTE